jgi:hypothetical protein
MYVAAPPGAAGRPHCGSGLSEKTVSECGVPCAPRVALTETDAGGQTHLHARGLSSRIRHWLSSVIRRWHWMRGRSNATQHHSLARTRAHTPCVAPVMWSALTDSMRCERRAAGGRSTS